MNTKAFKAYNEAREKCANSTGVSLREAQRAEDRGIREIIEYRSKHFADVSAKLKLLSELHPRGPWTDGRELDLINSIRRDIEHLVA